jgi:hypothetical protein
MRVPTRVRISWVDDKTLRLETDTASQIRIFRFDAPAAPAGTEASWQGYSVATWTGLGAGKDNKGTGGQWGNLRVVTTNIRGSAGEVTENFTRHSEFGNEYFTVIVTANGRSTSSTFKKEKDDTKFEKTTCEAPF